MQEQSGQVTERVHFYEHGQLAVLEIGLAGVEIGFDGWQIECGNKEASDRRTKES